VVPSELIAIRDHIDAVDSELVRLLAMRLALVTSAAEYKHDRESVSDPARVEAVIARVRSLVVDHGAQADAIEAVYRAIIKEGIELEAIAYEQSTWQSTAPMSLSPAADVAANVASSHLLSVMATMRSMRRLDDRAVAPELLEKLIQAASWAPVGANRQDYRFVIVTDRSQLARLAPHWSKAMEFYLQALSPPMSPDESVRFARVRDAMIYQCENFARIPALIVVCRKQGSFWRRLIGRPRTSLRALSDLRLADRLRVLSNLHIWACRASAASVYPAVENLLLAARAHGLAATLTTWHSAFEKEFKAVLEIPRAMHIYAIVPVGYPLGRFGPVRRLPAEQLTNYERWHG